MVVSQALLDPAIETRDKPVMIVLAANYAAF